MVAKRGLFLILTFLFCININSGCFAQEKKSPLKSFKAFISRFFVEKKQPDPLLYILFQENAAHCRMNFCIFTAFLIASHFASPINSAFCLVSALVYLYGSMMAAAEAARIRKKIEDR